jgi:hypothetical protein
MALRSCRECGKEVSTGASVCPHCGVKAPTRRVSRFWVIAIGTVAVVAILGKLGEGQQAASVPAAPPETAAQKAEREKADAQVRVAAAAAKALKSGMKNPDSFKLEEALVMDDGTVCFEYRATNSFNAVVPGQAVYVPKSDRLIANTHDGFARAWKAGCQGKSGRPVAAMIRMFVL